MPGTPSDNKYSSTTGAIFLFNLIVGTGALALPGALQKAGWVIGVALLLTLALFSFITVTFIVESLAVSNAVNRKRYGEAPAVSEDARQRLIPQAQSETGVFTISEKYELGQMGVLLTPKWCQIVIYGSLCLYLFGDLAIYAVVFGNTCSNVICSYHPEHKGNASNVSTPSENDPCLKNSQLSRISVYRISVVVFIVLVGPFAFFNLQKTKLLQIATGVCRWLAFFIMITWSTYKLITDGRKGNPKIIDLKSLPTLFGTIVYSFMCQHSIPGLLHPVRRKEHIKYIIPTDYCLVAIFYLALCLTAIFAFAKVEDIYTFNFWELTLPKGTPLVLVIIAYYLALFPVFTLSTNFPMLAITLRNNFRAMILKDRPKKWYLDNFLFPLIIIVPPICLAIAVSNLGVLLGIIGSFCGTCVQYLIPSLLVTYARKQASSFNEPNIFASPFKHKAWVYSVHIWMAISLIFITINYFKDYIY